MRKAHHGWVMVTQRRMKQLVRVMTHLCLEISPTSPPPHHSPSPFPAALCLTGALIIQSSRTCTSVAELQNRITVYVQTCYKCFVKIRSYEFGRGGVVEKYYILMHNGGNVSFCITVVTQKMKKHTRTGRSLLCWSGDQQPITSQYEWQVDLMHYVKQYNSMNYDYKFGNGVIRNTL